MFWALYFHDFGKVDLVFQEKIYAALKIPFTKKPDDRAMIPHNYLSGALINKKWMNNIFPDQWDREILYTAIYYHHNRKMTGDEASDLLQSYLKMNVETMIDLFSMKSANIPAYTRPEKISDYYEKYDLIAKYNREHANAIQNFFRYIKIKGMLHRVDYCASAHLPIEIIPEKSIGEKTQSYMQKTKKFPLREAQHFMLANQNENTIVVAATGSGKTEAALLWIGQEKAFYTLPLKVSINAIYDRIKEEIDYKEVALLHSDALVRYIENHNCDEDPFYQYQISRLLSAPLTVCTIDQLFKFTYRRNGSEMHLATLAHSRLIIDEIQTYSPDLIATILYGLKLITELGGRFAIITATFPPIFYSFLDRLKIPYKSPEKKEFFYGDTTHRHRIQLLRSHEFPFDEILRQGKSKKVLVIVNTVAAAQKVYEKLRERGGRVNLLHSAFIREDRALLERTILEFAPNCKARDQKAGIWVCTQIVEASLDIDFDVLFTEMCAIDQLMQRMGRVYRSREYFSELPNVIIIDNRNGVRQGIISEELYDASASALVEIIGGDDSLLLMESKELDMKQNLIQRVYGDASRIPQYYAQIQKRIDELNSLKYNELDEEKVDKLFRNIDSKTIIPRCVYEANREMVDELIAKIKTPSLSQEEKKTAHNSLLNYTINISFYHGLDIGDPLYTYSNIYFYNGAYHFDKNALAGEGLIKQYRSRSNMNGEGIIF